MANPLALGVKKIAGPFKSKEKADDWRFNEGNYQPHLRVATGYDGKFYVADPREADKKVLSR